MFLSNEIWYNILLYAFSPQDYMNIALTCKTWYTIVTSEYYFTKIVKKGLLSANMLLNYPFIRNIIIKNTFYKVIISFLINSSYDPSQNNNYAARFICRQGQTELLEILLKDKRVNLSNDCLHIACKFGNIETIKLLLKHVDIDPTTKDNYCLRQAIKNQYHDIVDLLMKDPRIDINFDNNWAIKKICKLGDIQLFEMFFRDPRIDIFMDDNFCIKIVCRYAHINILKILLTVYTDEHMNVVRPIKFVCEGCVDGYGNNNRNIRLECIQLLIAHGFYPTNVCLELATITNSTEIVKYLYEYGCNPNVHDSSCLRLACKYGNIELVKLFLADSRVKIKKQIRDIIVMLTDEYYAYPRPDSKERRNYGEIIKMLLNSGVNPCICNNYLLRKSIKYKDKNMIDYLTSHDAIMELLQNQTLS